MIKLTKLLFAFSLLFVLASCGNDDDPESVTLEGTWKAISFDADVEISSTFNGTTTASKTIVTGANLDYELTLDDPNWTTSGDYTYTVDITVDGTPFQNSTETLTNISGLGTYSVDGNMMTINGSFFEYELNGMTSTSMSDTQTVEYEINSDGQLVFTQDEEIETTASGVTSISKIKSTSVWEKQ